MQRFYGGDVSEWWTMPVVELNAFSDQLIVLQAQDSLRIVNEIGVGTGSMKQNSINRIMREWRRDSGATAAYRREARNHAKLTPLSSVGIGRG